MSDFNSKPFKCLWIIHQAGVFSSWPLRGSPYFRLLLVSVVWNTLEADMRFSMYWPRTWFSDFSFRFSSLTPSTLEDRSEHTHKCYTAEWKLNCFYCWSCALNKTRGIHINNHLKQQTLHLVLLLSNNVILTITCYICGIFHYYLLLLS